MRIGPVDLTTPTVVYAAALAGVVVVLLGMWQSAAATRTEGYYSNTIQRGIYDDNARGEAIAACQTLLSKYPEKNAVRMNLATMYFRDGKLADAQKTYEEAATRGSNEEKAWAYAGAAVAAYEAGAKADRGKAIAAAEALLQKALGLYSDSAEANGNMALLELLKGAQADAESALRYAEKALEAKQPLSLPIQEQLYYAHGLMLARKGKSAQAEMERAVAMRPGWKEPIEARRMSVLAGILDKEHTPQLRKELLEAAEKEIPTQPGKLQTTFWNSIGAGYAMLRAGPEGPQAYDRALRLFRRAVDADAKDPRGYTNLAALFEDRIQELAKQLTTPVTGINGESPVAGPWTPEPPKLPAADQTVLSQIKSLLRDQAALWVRFNEKMTTASCTPEQKAAGLLRYSATLRRLNWLADNDSERKNTNDRALTIAKELCAIEAAGPEAHFVMGHVLIDRGDLGGALESFEKAKAKGMHSAHLERMLLVLSKKAEAGDIRPGPGRRTFGKTPLIGATLRGLTGGSAKKATLKIDSKEVQATLAGSQIFYLPSPGDLTDGKHTVEITVVDAKDVKVELPPVEFHLDKKAPAITIKPDEGEALVTTPVWSIKLTDGSGIDYASLRVTLKSAKPGGGVSAELIRDGKYNVALPAIGVKANEAIQTDLFKLATTQSLSPGEYILNLEVRDLAGNQASIPKVYHVK